MEAFLDACLAAEKRENSSIVYLIANDERFTDEILEKMSIPVVVGTSNTNFAKKLERRKVEVNQLKSIGAESFEEIRSHLTELYASGLIRSTDRVLCLLFNDVHGIVSIDIGKTGIPTLEKVKGVDKEVIESLLSLSFELIKEGRESSPVGTLFVVGDTNRVMKMSRQVIINPFKGHTEEDRNLQDKDNWETLKEFAMLDGGFIVRKDGVVEAGGRYINIDWRRSMPRGVGGRHMAAISITKATKAIAFVISTSGVLRVFKDGEEIFKV